MLLKLIASYLALIVPVILIILGVGMVIYGIGGAAIGIIRSIPVFALLLVLACLLLSLM